MDFIAPGTTLAEVQAVFDGGFFTTTGWTTPNGGGSATNNLTAFDNATNVKLEADGLHLVTTATTSVSGYPYTGGSITTARNDNWTIPQDGSMMLWQVDCTLEDGRDIWQAIWALDAIKNNPFAPGNPTWLDEIDFEEYNGPQGHLQLWSGGNALQWYGTGTSQPVGTQTGRHKYTWGFTITDLWFWIDAVEVANYHDTSGALSAYFARAAKWYMIFNSGVSGSGVPAPSDFILASYTRWSATLAAVATPPGGTTVTAPANTAVPTISGTPVVGDVLTMSEGSWSGSPTSYAYTWTEGTGGGTASQTSSAIAGATSATLTVTAAMVGKQIGGWVTATNSAGSATAYPAWTAAVTAATVPPVTTTPPPVSTTTAVPNAEIAAVQADQAAVAADVAKLQTDEAQEAKDVGTL